MKRYTVAMATWYNGAWHIDYNTESSMMDECNVIIEGRRLKELGAVPMYIEYKGNERVRTMNEFEGHLEYAFVEL